MRDASTIEAFPLFEPHKQTIKLFQKGMTRIVICEIVGVHHNTVGEWIKLWGYCGNAALKVHIGGRLIGNGRILMPHEEHKVKKYLIDIHPGQLKLPFTLWTRKAVKILGKELFDVDLAIRIINFYLKRWNFTLQKPLKRAYERNEKHVNIWLNEEYPVISLKVK